MITLSCMHWYVRSINPCLVLVQPRKTRPGKIEKLFTGNVKNLINQSKPQGPTSFILESYGKQQLNFIYVCLSFPVVNRDTDDILMEWSPANM